MTTDWAIKNVIGYFHISATGKQCRKRALLVRFIFLAHHPMRKLFRVAFVFQSPKYFSDAQLFNNNTASLKASFGREILTDPPETAVFLSHSENIIISSNPFGQTAVLHAKDCRGEKLGMRGGEWQFFGMRRHEHIFLFHTARCSIIVIISAIDWQGWNILIPY